MFVYDISASSQIPHKYQVTFSCKYQVKNGLPTFTPFLRKYSTDLPFAWDKKYVLYKSSTKNYVPLCMNFKQNKYENSLHPSSPKKNTHKNKNCHPHTIYTPCPPQTNPSKPHVFPPHCIQPTNQPTNQAGTLKAAKSIGSKEAMTPTKRTARPKASGREN